MAYRKFLPALLLATPLLAHSAPYNVKQLGLFATDDSYASSINNAGAVVGTHHPGEDHQPIAFLAAGGKASYPGSFAAIRGINDHGVISGNDYSPTAYTWQNGQMTQLADLGYGAEGGRINNAGAAVGLSLTATGYHATVFSNGTVQDLGALYGGNSLANDINDSGVVVGETARVAGTYSSRAFIYANGVMSDIGTLAGDVDSAAYAINAGGAVTGQSRRDGSTRAFLYQDGSMVDLGTLSGFANSAAGGINDAGQVVGWGFTGRARGAFLYHNGTLTDLDTLLDPALGWHVEKAYDINESGDIAARACKAGLGCEIVVLTMAPVPEPETYAMLLAGFGLLGFVARRRARPLMRS
eukprot:gene30034-37184_t